MAIFPVKEKHRAFLYHKQISKFNNKVSDLLIELRHPSANYQDVLENISESLDNIFLPDFVLDFDRWIKSSLHDKKMTDIIADYWWMK